MKSEFCEDRREAAFGHKAATREINILAKGPDFFDRAPARRFLNNVLKMGMEHFAVIGGHKNNPARFQDRHRVLNKARQVFLDAERTAIMTGKRRRVQDDHAETVVFLDRAREVFRRVRANEFVLFAGKGIEAIIHPAPLEYLLADIHIHDRSGAPQAGVHPEGTGVGEKIQDLPPPGQRSHTTAVGAHVQEKAGVERVVKVNAEFHAGFLDGR